MQKIDRKILHCMFTWQKHEKVVCVERCFRYWDHPFYYLLSVSVCAIARHAYAQLLASFKVHIINQPPSPCTVRKENIIQLYIHCKSFFYCGLFNPMPLSTFARRLLRKVASAVRRIKKGAHPTRYTTVHGNAEVTPHSTNNVPSFCRSCNGGTGYKKAFACLRHGRSLLHTWVVRSKRYSQGVRKISPIRCCLARKTVMDLFGSLIRQYFAFVRCRGKQ